jgi:hypothetical protein
LYENTHFWNIMQKDAIKGTGKKPYFLLFPVPFF